MTSATQFDRGDVVEVPKRLGGGRGVVAHAWRGIGGKETCQVARLVNGRVRLTVIPEDELYRLDRIEVGS